MDFDFNAAEADLMADASADVADTLSALAALDAPVVQRTAGGRIKTQRDFDADAVIYATAKLEGRPVEDAARIIRIAEEVQGVILGLFETKGWTEADGYPMEIAIAGSHIAAFVAALEDGLWPPEPMPSP